MKRSFFSFYWAGRRRRRFCLSSDVNISPLCDKQTHFPSSSLLLSNFVSTRRTAWSRGSVSVISSPASGGLGYQYLLFGAVVVGSISSWSFCTNRRSCEWAWKRKSDPEKHQLMRSQIPSNISDTLLLSRSLSSLFPLSFLQAVVSFTDIISS